VVLALGAGALGLELRDIGARHEGLVAVAFDHDQPDLWIGIVPLERRRQRRPHVVGHGVVLRRVRDDDAANGAVALHDKFGHAVLRFSVQRKGYFETPAAMVSSRSRWPSSSIQRLYSAGDSEGEGPLP